MNNDLRWRKWPEEKPIQGERIIYIPEKADLEINDVRWKLIFIATFINREFVDDEFRECKVNRWIPLSALPKVDDESKTTGEGGV